MLILILIVGRSSQNAGFSFEKGSNCQNSSSSSGSHYPLKKSPQQNFWFPPTPNDWGGIYPTPTPYCYLENPARSKGWQLLLLVVQKKKILE